MNINAAPNPETTHGQLLLLADTQTGERIGDVLPPKTSPAWNETNLPSWLNPRFCTVNTFVPLPRGIDLAIVASYESPHREIARLARVSFIMVDADERVDVTRDADPELYEDDLSQEILVAAARRVVSAPEQVALQAFHIPPTAMPKWRFNRAVDRRIHATSGYFTKN